MLDTDRYHRWVAMLTASDRVLEQLALLAFAAVFVWERVRGWPEPWRGRMRLVIMAAALGFLLVQVVTTRGTLYVMLAGLALSVGGRALWAYWDYRRRHLAGAAVVKGVEQS